ncbi:helix-turn-helix domain-containing protein [Obesumbacterium proteus]|nr:helix-turn-helix transcriptional regulator [Obesumbacterium proteus]
MSNKYLGLLFGFNLTQQAPLNGLTSMTYKKKTAETTIDRDRIFVTSGINRFSERLKTAMNGMSNSELGRKSGMSETTVRKYLRGDIYPGIDSAALVAHACNVSLIWLLCGVEQKNEVMVRNSFTKSDNPADAILQRLSTEQVEVLTDAIISHGISGILSALNGMANVENFLQLSEAERARVLRVYEQIKEGTSQSGQGIAQQSLLSDDKQAG